MLLRTETLPSDAARRRPAAPDAGTAAARRLLICSDAPELLAETAQELRAEGIETVLRRDLEPTTAAAGFAACALHATSSIGGQIGRLRDLRAHFEDTPMLVLCATLRELDHVLALEVGADDVMEASASAAVVAARLRALWRRGQPAPASAAACALRFGELTIDRQQAQVTYGGRDVALTGGEFEVLWLLASQAGRAVPRQSIMRCVRGIDESPQDRSIDSRVYRLRLKLRDAGIDLRRIRTLRNRGYVFVDQAT